VVRAIVPWSKAHTHTHTHTHTHIAGPWWLKPVILATQEIKIRRIEV
jgi:hypothetical protein